MFLYYFVKIIISKYKLIDMNNQITKNPAYYSDDIQENYKELTINIATLFNDLGTFLSGIFGLLALKYWFNSTERFS